MSTLPEGAQPPSAFYSCGYCACGPYSADMSKLELIKHLAMMHNIVIRSRQIGLPVLIR
jgi:hypothetical protein